MMIEVMGVDKVFNGQIRRKKKIYIRYIWRLGYGRSKDRKGVDREVKN